MSVRRAAMGANIARLSFIGAMLIFVLVPLYWVFVTSIKPVSDYQAIPPVWFPAQPTVITFSKGVVFGDKPVSAGAYRLSAVPAKSEWTLVLTRIADPAAAARGEVRPDPGIVRVKVPARTCPPRCGQSVLRVPDSTGRHCPEAGVRPVDSQPERPRRAGSVG